MSLGWSVLGLAVQVTTIVLVPQKIGRGRLLTRPMQRVIKKPSNRLAFRCLQIWAGIACEFAGMPAVAFSLLLVALYLDDYLTGDDDQWRRFRDAARNAIKWRMELPPRPEVA